MNRLRARTTVITGAAFGVIAGAAVFGAASSSSATMPTSPAKVAPASAVTALATAAAARCAAGQEPEHGVCIVHVERVVVRPAPGAAAQSNAAGTAAVRVASGSSDDHAEHAGDDHS